MRERDASLNKKETEKKYMTTVRGLKLVRIKVSVTLIYLMTLFKRFGCGCSSKLL